MDELVDFLRGLGLNSYEAKAYAVLYHLREASAAEISEKANIPRARVYDTLENLEKKGFIKKSADKPLKYASFDIELALENYFSLKEKEIKNLKLKALSKSKSFKRKYIESSGNLWILKGIALHNKIKEFMNNPNGVVTTIPLSKLYNLKDNKHKIVDFPIDFMLKDDEVLLFLHPSRDQAFLTNNPEVINKLKGKIMGS